MELLRLEEYVFQLGSWKSIEELEDSVNLEELHRLVMAQRRKEHEERAFAAAMKGVELEPFNDPDYADVRTPEEIKEAAMKRRAEFFGLKEEDDPDNEFGYEMEG